MNEQEMSTEELLAKAKRDYPIGTIVNSPISGLPQYTNVKITKEPVTTSKGDIIIEYIITLYVSSRKKWAEIVSKPEVKESVNTDWCVQATNENRPVIMGWIKGQGLNGDALGLYYGLKAGKYDISINPFDKLLTTQEFYDKIGHKPIQQESSQELTSSPKKWFCAYSNREEFNTMMKWCSQIWGWAEPNNFRGCSYKKMWHYDPKTDLTPITFDQFKKWVLEESTPKVEAGKPSQSKSMNYRFKVGDRVKIIWSGSGCSSETIGEEVSILELGKYDSLPGYRISETKGNTNSKNGMYKCMCGERSFELVTLAKEAAQPKHNFKLGERVLYNRQEVVIVGFHENDDTCVIQGYSSGHTGGGSLLDSYLFNEHRRPIKSIEKTGKADLYFVSLSNLEKIRNAPIWDTKVVEKIHQRIVELDEIKYNPYGNMSDHTVLSYDPYYSKPPKGWIDPSVKPVKPINVQLVQPKKVSYF